jgi:hypothetical protein
MEAYIDDSFSRLIPIHFCSTVSSRLDDLARRVHQWACEAILHFLVYCFKLARRSDGSIREGEFLNGLVRRLLLALSLSVLPVDIWRSGWMGSQSSTLDSGIT